MGGGADRRCTQMAAAVHLHFSISFRSSSNPRRSPGIIDTDTGGPGCLPGLFSSIHTESEPAAWRGRALYILITQI